MRAKKLMGCTLQQKAGFGFASASSNSSRFTLLSSLFCAYCLLVPTNEIPRRAVGRIRESWPHRSVGSGHSEVLAGLNLARAAVRPVLAWESIATVHSARWALQHSNLSVETEPFSLPYT